MCSAAGRWLAKWRNEARHFDEVHSPQVFGDENTKNFLKKMKN
jgi:hypothetical protein